MLARACAVTVRATVAVITGLNTEIAAAVRVMRSGHLVQGPEVASFEQEFATLVDGRDYVAVNSGTSALCLYASSASTGSMLRLRLLTMPNEGVPGG